MKIKSFTLGFNTCYLNAISMSISKIFKYLKNVDQEFILNCNEMYIHFTITYTDITLRYFKLCFVTRLLTIR